MPATNAKNDLAGALRETLISPNVSDSNMEPANVVDALDGGLHAIARQIKWLGGGDNSDPRGAIEFLAVELKEGLELIAASNLPEVIDRSSTEISVSLDRIAEAITKLSETVSDMRP
jgi:hypothetical protein